MTGFLPPNVRKVRLTIDLATADGGSINTLAADNISLVLTTESMFGVNLLVNGDAEDDPQDIDFDNNKTVPGWNVHTDTSRSGSGANTDSAADRSRSR